MTPAWKAQHGYHATGEKWKVPMPPLSMQRTVGHGSHHLGPHPHPAGAGPPRPPLHPPLPLFHTRHAEQSAGRPHLVTVVRPCGQNGLRKVTVLLNRRGVVSFEQLLLDISEALGFPRWHRARVTRLYTPHAREVRGVCDFFRGEVAFLALGKARPELWTVLDALEELFPEPSRYRVNAWRAWEKKLRLAPDKATKADSGYSEETADSGEMQAQQEMRRNARARAEPHHNARRLSPPPLHTDARRHGHDMPNRKRSNKKDSCRQPTHPPNHLQAIRGKGWIKEGEPEEVPGDMTTPSPLCRNCLAGRRKGMEFELPNQIPRRVPLPPVSRKSKQNPHENHEDIPPASSSPQQIHIAEEQCLEQLKHSSIHSPRGTEPTKEETQQWLPFDLQLDNREVTLSDIERRYDIGRVIGDGNFAVVRECRRRDTGKTLAIKIVERSKLIGREHMMQNELSLLGSLSHPCVVRLFAHHHTHAQAYLVMELVNGGDLFEAIAERGTFPEVEAGLIVSDVSDALNYIHSKSILHRDLKPENLLIDRRSDGSSRLKLGDFGLAMIVTEPIFTVCGTPTYVAPEILSETGYGLAVDVWALGVILYILLCGFPPFRSQDRDQDELFQLIKQGQLHFLSPYWDPVSEGAKSLVRGLLQVDPTERLTAPQSLQHPWVQAMSTACTQGALLHRSQKTTTTSAREQDRQAQTNTGQTPRDKRMARTHSQQWLTHKAQINTAEVTGQHERSHEINTEIPNDRYGSSRANTETRLAEEASAMRSIGQRLRKDDLVTQGKETSEDLNPIKSTLNGGDPRIRTNPPTALTPQSPQQTSPQRSPSSSPRCGLNQTPAPSSQTPAQRHTATRPSPPTA